MLWSHLTTFTQTADSFIPFVLFCCYCIVVHLSKFFFSLLLSTLTPPCTTILINCLITSTYIRSLSCPWPFYLLLCSPSTRFVIHYSPSYTPTYSFLIALSSFEHTSSYSHSYPFVVLLIFSHLRILKLLYSLQSYPVSSLFLHHKWPALDFQIPSMHEQLMPMHIYPNAT